jgi:deoxyribonuclease V
VVLDVATLEVVEEATASLEVSFPYVPGLLSFRELPPLAAAWEKLSTKPDLVVFDAHGLAHPRRFGLACHGGLLFDAPAIGAAKSVLVGEAGPLGRAKGSQSDLVFQGEVVGRVLRTRSEVRPVYVSIGHRINLEAAVDLVVRMCPRFRIPEPIRRAHHLSNRVRLSQA